MSDNKMAIDSLHEENDLDALIADTSSLIASVYSILEQPRRSPARTTVTTTPVLGRRPYNNSSDNAQRRSNSNSPKSPKTPRSGLSSRTPFSTPSSQEIDREINRIDRFCEMLEHNLRSVTAGQLTESRLGSSSPPDVGAAIRSPRTTPPRNADPQPLRNQRRSPTPEEVIDLCDSMYIPTQTRRPYSFNTSSDDVIIVTPTGDEIVDLCTPTFQRNNVARVRNNYRRTIDSLGFRTDSPAMAAAAAANQRLVPSRRTFAPSSSHVPPAPTESSTTDARSSGSSVSTTTSTTNGAATPIAKQANNVHIARFEDRNISGTTSDNSGRVPFMCAVCMESCVNNQPTSTKCGHVYCSNCIRQAIRLTRKCPMCNTKVTANQLFRIYI